MTPLINITKKDEYHRHKLMTRQKLWEGRFVKELPKKENRAICIMLFSDKK